MAFFRRQHIQALSVDYISRETPQESAPSSPSPTRISTKPASKRFHIPPFTSKKHVRSSSLSLKAGPLPPNIASRVFQLLFPRWLRSVKGLLGLLLLGFVCLILYGATHPPMDPVVRARLAHQRAEHILNMHDFGEGNTTHHSGGLKQPPRPHDRHHIPSNVGAFHENGLMMAATGDRHPILALIEKGKRDWQALVNKQSRTLSEAASEYRRRYRRNPPRGFDAWWKFVQEEGVQLPDEYDQIHEDILPFSALEPGDFKHRYAVIQSRPLTFVLRLNSDSGEVSTGGPFSHIRRAGEMASLMKFFAHLLPHDVNMTFTIDDRPAIMMEYERKARMIEVASEGEHFGPSEFVDSPDSGLSNFALACPPNSALRRSERNEFNRELELQAGKKSFIWNPSRSNDLCRHPEFRQLHGYTVTNETELTPIIPIYTFAKMPTHNDLLITPLEQYWDGGYNGYDPPWEKKRSNKLLWRGSTTGAHFKKGYPWRLSQRARLHFMSRETNGTRQILTTDSEGKSRLVAFPASELNEMYMDTSFSGQPAQCDEETCELMKREIQFVETQGLDDSYQNKYLMDVDGNGWSGRFHRLMWTNSLVLKSTVFPEWYAQRLIPWYHYVPVKVDYTDLYDIMAFFQGTPDGEGAHEDLAKQIALNGKHFAEQNWRRVDMASYCFRLLLEVSRLLHPEESDFVDA